MPKLFQAIVSCGYIMQIQAESEDEAEKLVLGAFANKETYASSFSEIQLTEVLETKMIVDEKGNDV